MITACFARALQGCTSRICMHFLPMFQEVITISKTRNQFTLMVRGRSWDRVSSFQSLTRATQAANDHIKRCQEPTASARGDPGP